MGPEQGALHRAANGDDGAPLSSEGLVKTMYLTFRAPSLTVLPTSPGLTFA